MRVLIVPDKFKGTLTSLEAAVAMESGWTSIRPQDQVHCIPMSDGGDGFGPVLGRSIRAERQALHTQDAAAQPVEAEWWWSESESVAVLETAKIIGLAMLPKDRFHPFELDTFGLGTALKEIAQKGVRNCLAGIGGSATNDAGFGMARSLGWSFLDQDGQPISRWTELDRLKSVIPPQVQPCVFKLIIAVDVANPLCGLEGASRIYGPQKGLRSVDLEKADRCLDTLAKVLGDQTGIDYANEAGAGAAGGLGFGFRAFLGAELKPGFDIFSEATHLEDHIRETDLILTAEGAIDESTLMGKGVGEVAQVSGSLGKPCIGLAGVVNLSSSMDSTRNPFRNTYAMTPDLTTPEQAISDASTWLRRLSEKVAREWET